MLWSTPVSGVVVDDSLKSARRPGSTPSGVETLCDMLVGVPWAFPAPMAPKRCRSSALYDLPEKERGVSGSRWAWVGAQSAAGAAVGGGG